ncbi:MAG TPA: peptidylprolyl isomerase [Anaerolineales bacterium]|nr:peptidylprolyl isomerase [Anaerolineales bacterium]
MKRIVPIFFIVTLTLLAFGACAPAAPATPATEIPVMLSPIVIPNTPTPAPAFTCARVSVAPTPTANTASLFPQLSSADFSRGPADAPVTLIQYCDFQSQGCKSMADITAELLKNRTDLQVVFRPLPLIGVLDKSEASALAALAADEQGKFWEMHDLLFAKHSEWTGLTVSQFNAWVLKEAPAVGIDADQLAAAMKAPATAGRLTSLYEAAKSMSIAAVPLILINGEQFFLLDYQNINDTVGIIALGSRQFTDCPPFIIDASKQYIATIATEKGDIVLQLFPDKAPLAVNSFVFLAQQGWFDGVTFHRVIPGFMAQAGDPSGTGRGNPGYFFKNEISDLLFSKPGVVGMANSGPDTNGSQFFITYAPAAHLNGSYTIFGQVLTGMDVLEQITPRDPAQGIGLTPGDKILSVTVEVK